MSFRFFPVLCLFVLSGGAVCAKNAPLIRSSEETATSVCLAYEKTDAEMVNFCKAALDEFEHTPKNQAQLHNNYGYALGELKRTDLAIQQLKRALEIHPIYAEPWENMGWIYWSQNDYGAAKNAFERAHSLHSSASIVAGIASSMYRADQDMDAALTLLEQSELIDPDYNWAAVEKGWLLRKLGKYPDALESFETALARDKTYLSALYGAAITASKLDKYELGLDYINRALEIAVEEDYLIERSHILRSLGRPQQALRDAERALRQVENLDTGIVAAAWALKALGRSKEALTLFSDTQDANENSEFFWYYYGELLVDYAMWDDAEEALKKSIALGGDDAEDHHLLGFVLLQKSEYKSALASEQKALSIAPDHLYAHFNAAIIFAELDENELAFKHIVKAVSLGLPKDDASDFLARILADGKIGLSTRVGAVILKSRMTSE